MIDYIIVGSGIAGLCFAETLFSANKTFTVISDDSQNSSHVAAGLYNPVILKRFSLPENSREHLDYMKPFYRKIEERIAATFDFSLPVYRKFASYEEQNNWFEAADKPMLAPYLSTEIIPDKYPFLKAPFGFGRVLHTGYVDTEGFTSSYMSFLESIDYFISATFNYSELSIKNDSVCYKGIIAKNIIFAEGFGIHANPYFNYPALEGTKGELLIIKAPDLKLDAAVNAGVFILPVGNDVYKVGATYDWDNKAPVPTDAGRKELEDRLEGMISCPYEVIGHFAGIRPTVKDRKPLIGTHKEYKNLHLLNGLGTRGVMLGPYMAKLLYESIELDVPLQRSISLQRFNH